MADIGTCTRALEEVVVDLDAVVTDGEVDLDPWLTAWAVIEDANRNLQVIRGTLTKRLAEAMPDKRVTVMGVGTFVKHGKKDRTKWDTDDLLRAVLDTKRADVNGEPIEETQLDRVLHVWRLGAPRITALKERKLDADDFCHSEWGGYTLQLEAPT